MNEKELVKEIREYCSNHADPAVVEKYARYFREGFNAYGLSFDLIRDQSAKLLERGGLDMNIIVKAGIPLFNSGMFEEGSFAIWMLKSFRSEFTTGTFHGIGVWFESGISNWAHTDAICGDLLSVFLKKQIISPDEFSPWITSSFKYKRRAVPVSLIKLLKIDPDYQLLFNLIGPLMTDTERVVHQGTGWFLRESWKKKPELTEAFLVKWKDTSPRLIFQYATEKMTKENKERFRKTK